MTDRIGRVTRDPQESIHASDLRQQWQQGLWLVQKIERALLAASSYRKANLTSGPNGKPDPQCEWFRVHAEGLEQMAEEYLQSAVLELAELAELAGYLEWVAVQRPAPMSAEEFEERAAREFPHADELSG